ncbi:lysosome-associated membrane glycoprotein 2 isoform X2 [Danio aesculapii]|uniref:lysosome-associated membrane glycoprotein 2 isoform X2 n=1 Tax=Danio aesculapii TaxID=1142201 RepID=UPI0024BF1F50|nr:lysosome-associated membrane glycoprotein 2 isoform X2 [Danio aesculapii]
MAVRCFLALLFILLSGIVHADMMTSPLPSTAELKTANVTQTTSTTSTFRPTSTSTQSTLTTEPAAKTTSAHTTVTTSTPTSTQSTSSSSTEATVTTLAPTTTGHNTTNSTTEPPTTTGHNVTNSTTDAPTTTHTNATGAPTPPPTTPPVPKPTVGNYSVKTDNVSDCLLAKMGLQFSFKISGNASLQTVNLDPNMTKVNGTCGSGGSDSSLFLMSKDITVHFVFTNVSQKFHLHALTLTVDLGNGNIFNDSNTNLSLWEASVGSSYMCRKEQSYNISDKLTLNTFELQVQPFDVQKNAFSTAHECSLDDTSLLIPIIVGAALAGLIFIVVIAYVIGRRRTYVGYQTL